MAFDLYSQLLRLRLSRQQLLLLGLDLLNLVVFVGELLDQDVDTGIEFLNLVGSHELVDLGVDVFDGGLPPVLHLVQQVLHLVALTLCLLKRDQLHFWRVLVRLALHLRL